MARKFLTPVGLPSGTTLPINGSEGELFFKSDENQVYVHDGIAWKTVSDMNANIALAWWMGV